MPVDGSTATVAQDAAPCVRDAVAADFGAVLALNATFVRFLSPMSTDRPTRLHAQAVYHRVVATDAGVMAFLLAFAEGADYDSPNYRWFAARYQRFVYIDRIVVDARAQGRSLGQTLYDDLFAFARGRGVAHVAAEFDVDPPNPGSARFHMRNGFAEVGRQRLPNGKEVSLQVAPSAQAKHPSVQAS